MSLFAEQLKQQKAVKNSPVWHIAALLLVVAFVALVQSQSRNYFDDAYMFVRYADHLLQGFGHSWNAGEISIYGSTSIFYVLQVTAVRALAVFSATQAVVLLSSFWALASVAVLAQITSQLLRLASFSKSFSLQLLALMFCSPFLYHANTGMDTSLSFFCISLLLFFSLYCCSAVSFLKVSILAIVAFLAIAARPDNAIVALSLPCLLLLFTVKNSWRYIFTFVGLTALLLAIDLGLKNYLLHDPLPLAFYAKRNGFYQGYQGHYLWNPVSYLLIFFVSSLPYLAFLRKPTQPQGLLIAVAFLLPLGLTVAYYFTVVQVMGHLARYYFPFLPLVIVYCLVSFAAFKAREQTPWNRKKSLKQVFYALLLIVVALPLPGIYQDYWQKPSPEYSSKMPVNIEAEDGLPVVSRWGVIKALAEFSKHLPKGTRFAMSEYGYIGAKASDLHIIDLLGLHDRYIAHNGFSEDYILAQRPDIIWLAHSDYSRINGLIVDHPDFQKHYDFYPDAFLYGFAIRKDSPHFNEINQGFDKLWQQFYQEDKNRHQMLWPMTRPKSDL